MTWSSSNPSPSPLLLSMHSVAMSLTEVQEGKVIVSLGCDDQRTTGNITSTSSHT